MATSHFNLSNKLNAIFNLTNVLLAAVFIMKELIEVFRMNEVSIGVRCRIIIQLGLAINDEHRMNITEPLVYELVKQLDPDNKDVETEHYTRKRS